MASLRGAAQLEARLRAVGVSGEGMAPSWATDAANLMRERIPYRTGRTRASVHVGAISSTRAEVRGSYVAHILDIGAKAHDEKPKHASVLRWTTGGGQPVFAKRVRHPALAGSHFTTQAAQEAARTDLSAAKIIEAWNLGA